MKVLCFGIAREIIGQSQYEIIDQNLETVSGLKSFLQTEFPSFSQYKQFQIAVNQEFVDDNHTIGQNDEIAIIPPVSGG